MEPAAEDREGDREKHQRPDGDVAVLCRLRRGQRRALHPCSPRGPQLGAPLAGRQGAQPAPELRHAVEEPGRERDGGRGVEEDGEDLTRVGLLVRVGAVVVVDEHVGQALGGQRQVARDQRIEEPASEHRAGMCAKSIGEHPLQPDRAEEQQGREHRERIVVELRRREGEDRETDQEPEEQEQQGALPRGLRAEAHAREHRGRAGKREDPGEAVVSDLLDEVGEAAARGGGVHAEGEPLEVIVQDEALEEGLPLVVPTIEREQGAVPGGADAEDDQRAHAEVQPPEAMPLACDDAVQERDRPGEREAEQSLGESREAHQAEEGRRPAFARLILEEDDHQAGHRAVEETHEHRVRHRLASEEDEDRAGEDGDRSDHRGPPSEQPIRHHEQEQRTERGEKHVRQPHGPFGVDARPAFGTVGVGDQHGCRHQPEIQRRLGEEPRRLPPGVEVIASRDHLARDLAVVWLPGVPEPGRPQPRHEKEDREGGEADGQALLGAERRKPAKPGHLPHEPREAVAPVGEGLRFLDAFLDSRHRVPAPVTCRAASGKRAFYFLPGQETVTAIRSTRVALPPGGCRTIRAAGAPTRMKQAALTCA